MEIMQEVLVFATILVAISTAVVEVIKKAVNIPVNILPAISVVVGVLIGWAAYPFTDLETVLRIWAGGLAGLSGTGLYELIAKREGTSK